MRHEEEEEEEEEEEGRKGEHLPVPMKQLAMREVVYQNPGVLWKLGHLHTGGKGREGEDQCIS